MKKKVSLALAVAMATSVGATAMAAPANPFSDVPSKHWSYNAVQQLAKAGIVDGFNDGTFKGDKTMTRYEMATIVARAMAKVDKADAQQKAMIDKLAAEYSTELQNLGVRVTNLENKVGNIKLEGYARMRGESYRGDTIGSTQHGASRTRERVRVYMTAPINEDWTFKGRLQYESFENSNTTNNSSDITMANAYVTGKALGLDQISVGRVPLWLGQGFIADLSGNNTQSAPTTFAIGKKMGAVNLSGGFGRYAATYHGGAAATMNLSWASLQAAATDNLTFDVAYLQSGTNATYSQKYYKTTAFGLKYTGFENFTLSGEYGKNTAEGAKVNGESPKAYEVTLKYKGADKKAVNTWGLWVSHKKVDNQFDSAAFTTDETTLGSTWYNGFKGQEYGIEYVPFKNGVLSFKYENMKTTNGLNQDFSRNNKSYIGQLEVWF